MKLFDARVRLDRFPKSLHRFESEPVEKGLILFYGDSCFTRWNTEKWGNPSLEEEIRRKDGSRAVVNHGFGTSTAEHQLYYYSRMVRPWEPKVLVLRTAGNDRGAGYSPTETLYLQSRLMDYARADFPGVRFFLLGMHGYKRDIGLTGYRAKWRLEYNELLQDYCAKHDDCAYLNFMTSPLFFNDPADVGDFDKIRTDMFCEDEAHFNALGYKLCAEFFREVLDEYL